MERITTVTVHRFTSLLNIAIIASAMRCFFDELGIRILPPNDRGGIIASERLHFVHTTVHDVLMVMMLIRFTRRDILVKMQVRLRWRRFEGKAEIDGLIIEFIVDRGVKITCVTRCHHDGRE